MAGAVTTAGPGGASPMAHRREVSWRRMLPVLRYFRRTPSLGVGLLILLGLALFVIFGYLLYDTSRVTALSVAANRSPSLEFLLGTDRQGRDMLAVMIVGTFLTLMIGLIAGALGVVVGLVLGFVSAYYGGWVDNIIKTLVDTLLTIPGLLVLVIIAVSLSEAGLTVLQMAMVVSILAWLFPTRQIRSQVLVMREKGYVEIARLSGMSNLGIIVKEMMPNLAPYVAASFVGAVAAAILASIGLEALGLGPLDSATIGMTIYWNIWYSSILHGLWWWLIPPIIVIVSLFVGLFLVTAGLDEIANPRLRRRV